MGITYEKPSFYFCKGYRDYLDGTPPTRHFMSTCYSEMNRYPEQIQYIKSMMETNKEGPLKILNIGVAQGQEPLTHIKSAFELSQKYKRPISDFIDLITIDILSVPPELCHEAKTLDKKIVDFLMNIYDTRSGKSKWGTPIETIIDKMTQKGEKQDVILFNNVLQHMSPKNEDALFLKLDKLIKLTKENGLFCYTQHAISEFEQSRTTKMLKLLNENGFKQISTGIFKKVKL